MRLNVRSKFILFYSRIPTHIPQIVNYGMPIQKALDYNNQPTSYQSMRERVNNHYDGMIDLSGRGKLKNDWKCVIQHHKKMTAYHQNMINFTVHPPEPTKSPSPSSLTEITPGASTIEGKSNKKKRKRSGVSAVDYVAAATQAAIETSLPDWVDPSTTEKVMTKRSKRTSLQVCRDNFEENAVNAFQDAKYKQQWKLATAEYAANLADPEKRGPKGGMKNGFGVNAVVKRVHRVQACLQGGYQEGTRY